ncbi:hypothetical protein AAF712_009884 [Marasmius tenuissimus]|uniref:Uncharacterized protein n=1 Tax=Marasmius tenuissimus TaxID=585030 RepID=A0ABR2ZNF1_9AGAR
MAANSLLVPTLPAANMAILAATLGNSATAESAVNGAWIAILNHYFPQPRFIIKPELRVPNAGDADLVVQSQVFANNAVTWKWRVCYEGKAPGAVTVHSLRSQVAEYPRKALKGDLVEVKPVDFHRGNVRIQDTASSMPPVYDIVNDQVAINTIMGYMAQNP